MTFIAYILPVNICLTLNTVPNPPTPNNFNILNLFKSILNCFFTSFFACLLPLPISCIIPNRSSTKHKFSLVNLGKGVFFT